MRAEVAARRRLDDALLAVEAAARRAITAGALEGLTAPLRALDEARRELEDMSAAASHRFLLERRL
jgi:hypothetical protein